MRKSLTAAGSGVQLTNISKELVMLIRPSSPNRRRVNKTRDAAMETLAPLFNYVADPANASSTLNLHNVAVSDWTRFFMDGKAAMVVSKMFGYAVGFARLAPRMSAGMMKQLSISPECPEVFELGNLTVARPFQELGLPNKLIGALADMNRHAMKESRMVIIGTMTGRAAARGFKTVFESKGYPSEFRHHLDFESLAPLTCKCTTNGTGFNVSIEGGCALRISKGAPEMSALNGALSSYTASVPTKLPCVLFVSDPKVAQRANEAIKATYPTTPELVEALRGIGYY